MIVTSLSVAREREQGTPDQLLVSPLTTPQIFIGKAVLALIVATFQLPLCWRLVLAYQIPSPDRWRCSTLRWWIYGFIAGGDSVC